MANLAQYLEEATQAVVSQRIFAVEYRALLEEIGDRIDRTPALLADARARLDPLVFERLEQGYTELCAARGQLVEFCETAELALLDSGLGACRRADFLLLEAQALQRRVAGDTPLLPILQAPVELEPPLEDFELQVTRQAGVSRATFRCPTCGWEFSYAREIDATDFLELPLSDFTCPMCEEDQASR